ncbi:MAG: hypothetical protein C0594_14610 [Marinilabiliales bacterium]|nr:MAG: hypothetical protein C0594_14610 [Marinilabiliales bacterium]
MGSIDDKYFFNNYLKSTYLYDAVNNVSSSCYQAEAISGTFAEELGSILFDNGTFNTYNVAYPDVIEPVNGSFPFLFYLAYPEQYAGVAYTGIFPGGISEGKIVYLGFPFETIVDSITRNDLLGEVFHYFDLSSDLELSRVPYITKVFPNPSNGLVYIKSEQKIQKVRIFNLLGEELGIESVVNVDSICLFFKQNRGVFLIYIYYEDSFSIEKVIIR